MRATYSLHGAHCDLVNSDPSTTTVRQVAEKWGFRQTNHFAELHGGCFEESPKVTLRRTGQVSARAGALSIAQLQTLWSKLQKPK